LSKRVTGVLPSKETRIDTPYVEGQSAFASNYWSDSLIMNFWL
jgi:hypothetical protein